MVLGFWVCGACYSICGLRFCSGAGVEFGFFGVGFSGLVVGLLFGVFGFGFLFVLGCWFVGACFL